MSALESCSYFDLHLLRQEFFYQYALEPILYHLVPQSDEFFDNDFGTNNCRKLIIENVFPVVQTYCICQVASVCRGSAWNKRLESLLVDWEREKIDHCNSIPHLDIHLNHSKNSSAFKFPAFVKCAFVLSQDSISTLY